MNRLNNLTPRQLEIALLVAQACANKEIAARLEISEQTVKNTLMQAFLRTGVSDRVALALLVVREKPDIPLPSELIRSRI